MTKKITQPLGEKKSPNLLPGADQSLVQELENKGTWEQRNLGTKELGNKGTWEQRNLLTTSE